jgi:hypothetical protein
MPPAVIIGPPMPLDLDELRLISGYLNVVATKVAAGTLTLRWLTGGTETITGLTADARHEETQGLSFGGTLWIANNGDNDSNVQQAFLNWAGISLPGQLLTHAKTYSVMALPFHAGALSVARIARDEDRVLYAALQATGASLTANTFTTAGTVACGDFNLATAGGAPGRGAIVFVTGDYQCTAAGGNSCHAEQKLLGAMGRVLASGKDFYTVARVAGTKPPCKTCRQVIDAVLAIIPGLRFDTTQGRQNVNGITKLDVSHYFTVTSAPTTLAAGVCAECGVNEGVMQQYCARGERVPVCYSRECRVASAKLDWVCMLHR